MTDTVTVTAPVSYRAWITPNYAHLALPPGKRQDGFKETPGFPIAELPAEVLDALAKQWLDHLYAGVGRPNPFAMLGK